MVSRLALAHRPASAIVAIRRTGFPAPSLVSVERARVDAPSSPVIVVGGISVGGSGKTPLVLWLARLLLENGYRPGIVSRGYGGSATAPQ